MKNAKWLIIVIGVVALSACGGSDSGGGGGGEAAAEASAEALAEIMESCFSGMGAQTIESNEHVAVDSTKETMTCNCPGGGTATADTVTGDGTMTACKSLDGSTFTGTIAFDEADDTVDVVFALFGQCSNVVGEAIAFDLGACAGVITGTCSSETLTCNVVEPAAGDDSCDLECS